MRARGGRAGRSQLEAAQLPRRTDARVEERVCRLRRSTRRGLVYLGARTGGAGVDVDSDSLSGSCRTSRDVAMPSGSAKQRIREFLRQRVGEVVTGHQLKEVAGPGVTEWARRGRELRSDEGWEIHTHNDDIELQPGQYRRASGPPTSTPNSASRSLSARIRAEVLSRDGYTCQGCGAAAGDTGEDGRPIRLHLGHILDRSHGDTDEPSNLRTLRNTCNEGAKNLTREPPSRIWLLAKCAALRVTISAPSWTGCKASSKMTRGRRSPYASHKDTGCLLRSVPRTWFLRKSGAGGILHAIGHRLRVFVLPEPQHCPSGLLEVVGGLGIAFDVSGDLVCPVLSVRGGLGAVLGQPCQ